MLREKIDYKQLSETNIYIFKIITYIVTLFVALFLIFLIIKTIIKYVKKINDKSDQSIF